MEFKTRLEEELQEAERALTDSNALHAQVLYSVSNLMATGLSFAV